MQRLRKRHKKPILMSTQAIIGDLQKHMDQMPITRRLRLERDGWKGSDWVLITCKTFIFKKCVFCNFPNGKRWNASAL